MNAARTAAALARRAEAVCRRYLPRGRRLGRYWVAGNLDGDPGRSLYVRLDGPGATGKWTDAATGERGDLLDLVRHRSGAPTLRAALAEARAFLALPAAPAPDRRDGRDASAPARRLWRLCRAVDGTHAERYLRARGLAHCRFAALRFHPALRCRERGAAEALPALVAAATGDDGAVDGVQRTWLDPRAPAKANLRAPRKALGRIRGRAVRFGSPDGTLLVGEGVETVLSLVAAAPEIAAAAALSAAGLGAFAPPPASPAAARGRASPRRSSFPRAGISTTTCSRSVPPRSPHGSRPRCAETRRRRERRARERANRQSGERKHEPHRQSEAGARRRRRRGAEAKNESRAAASSASTRIGADRGAQRNAAAAAKKRGRCGIRIRRGETGRNGAGAVRAARRNHLRRRPPPLAARCACRGFDQAKLLPTKAYCVTRAHCANPCGVLHCVTAAARWLRCARVKQEANVGSIRRRFRA